MIIIVRIENQMNQLFKPIQPGIENNNRDIIYREFTPHIGLREYVYCYWTIHSIIPLTTPFIYHGIPDGCMDIYTNFNKYEK